LRAQENVRTIYTHFPLHPDTPPEGMSLEQLFAGRNVDLELMYQRMAKLMAQEGLPYSRRTHTYNSRLAQEVGKWAESQPGGAAFHDAMFRAYFVDTLNISDPEVIVKVVERIGLSGEEAQRVITTRSHKAAVDADWRRSMQMGVTGVPTFVAGGYGVVGAQPYEVLMQLVRQARQESQEEDR
jgi:predicted DsbA family dithiol-disulfide isomerase